MHPRWAWEPKSIFIGYCSSSLYYLSLIKVWMQSYMVNKLLNIYLFIQFDVYRLRINFRFASECKKNNLPLIIYSARSCMNIICDSNTSKIYMFMLYGCNMYYVSPLHWAICWAIFGKVELSLGVVPQGCLLKRRRCRSLVTEPNVSHSSSFKT